LLVVDIATGRERQLTHGLHELNSHPRWSADGQSLYFYQEAPTQSLRKLAVAGGKDVLVADEFAWPEQNDAAFSPDETHMVYTLRDGNHALDARVRNLASGEEWSLPLPLYACRWSADGQTIWGNSSHPEQIYRCALRGPCEAITAGEEARPAHDGQSLHFFRDDDLSIWRRDLATGTEQRLLQLENPDGLSFNWGVTPTGDIVYHVQDNGRPEMWLGEAVD
jgi:Tol biopolymer transport system component